MDEVVAMVNICNDSDCSNQTNSTEHEQSDYLFADETVHLVFTVSGVVSLVSLFIVFIVYLVIPDFNSLHGKIVLSNVVSVGFVSSFLLYVFNVQYNIPYLCEFVGYFGYFSSMSMFSWMTIMCYDLCSTLLQIKVQRNSSHGSRFLLYSVCGWGMGIILTTILLILQNTLPPQSDLHPGIGNLSCFLNLEGNSYLYLFHFPILIMMVINLGFFIIIVTTLSRAHKRTRSMRMSRR